jgi:hypothetical protein
MGWRSHLLPLLEALGNPPAAYNLALAILVLIVIFLQASFSRFKTGRQNEL